MSMSYGPGNLISKGELSVNDVYYSYWGGNGAITLSAIRLYPNINACCRVHRWDI